MDGKFILMRKTHFARKVFHLALFIKGEFLELGNCLLRTLRKINIKRISWIYFILQGFVFLLCDKHKMVVKTTNVTHTIRAFNFLIQFPQLFFLFKRPYCCTFACISARNHILMPNSIVWETSRHYAVPPPRFLEKWRLRNKRRLFPYWWSITSLIWQVLLIGRATWEICFNQSETLPRSCLLSDTSWVWNFYTRFSDVISRRNQCWRSEISAVSQATVTVM